jgi:hydroxymethylbilane synthase
MNRLIIGTRGSPLAMWQAGWIAEALRPSAAGLAIELKVITTHGDRSLESAERALGKGVFTKELELALLEGSIDLSVHSLKDLPISLPQGLVLASVPLREDPAEALVSRSGCLEDLPDGATILCGSLRRQAQVLARRPDLKIKPIRGNIGTRLAKFDASSASAMILARAGLVRLGLEGRISSRLDPQDFLPAAGQGALAVQCRADDRRVRRLVESIDEPLARVATDCERAVLAGLGGGCRLPVGAYARFDDDGATLTVSAMAAAPNGSPMLKDTLQKGPCQTTQAARELGLKLADRLRAAGADGFLRQFNSPSRPEAEDPP